MYDDYLMMKKDHGRDQAAMLVRFRLMHIREMLAVAAEEGILDKCHCREVDSLDVYFRPEMFDEAKDQLKTWKEDMPEESGDCEWVEGKEAIDVSRKSLFLDLLESLDLFTEVPFVLRSRGRRLQHGGSRSSLSLRYEHPCTPCRSACRSIPSFNQHALYWNSYYLRS